jgi:all-trans-retinol 13,14-reductase
MSREKTAPRIERDWDVIVVGSGVGGLVSAGYLAASGRKVLVLEQHDIAGGNGHVFRRRRSYEYDVGIHYLGDCGPGGMLPSILAGLGIADRVPFRRMDDDRFDRIILPSVSMDVPTGWPRYLAQLVRAFPEEAAGLTTFIEVCEAVELAHRDNTLGASTTVAGMSGIVRRWIRRTLTQLFDHCGLSARARTMLAAQSGNYGTSPSQVRVAMHSIMIGELMRGSYYPAGGGQSVVAALVEALESHGATLLTKTRVDRIEVEDGRVCGVRLADGTSLRAPVVVSNADLKRTVLELAGGAFSAQDTERAEKAQMRLATSTVYLALDRELDLPNGNIWYWPTEDVDQAYVDLENGEMDPQFALLSFPSLKDQGAASICPPGHTNIQIMTLSPRGYEPWGLSAGPASGAPYRREPGYLRAKAKLTESLLEMTEAVIGPFRDSITHLETATPLTHERYTRSTGGGGYGLATWGPAGRQPEVETSVEGLYLAGQNTRYGSGINGVATCGLACASSIMDKTLLPEVHRGAVFGNPELLPEREAGWDPLLVSRGAARRNARGLAKIDNTPRATAVGGRP